LQCKGSLAAKVPGFWNEVKLLDDASVNKALQIIAAGTLFASMPGSRQRKALLHALIKQTS